MQFWLLSDKSIVARTKLSVVTVKQQFCLKSAFIDLSE